MSTTDTRAAFEAWMRSQGMEDDHDLRRCAPHATAITGCDYSWGDIEARWEAWQAATEAAKATGTAGEFSLTKERIREIFLARGFTIKEGQSDLKPYVYDAAHALIEVIYAVLSSEFAAEAARQPAPVVAAQHSDDIAVDKFAAAMKAKMAVSRAKGRGGWDDPAQCDVADLCAMLVDHVEKGDPVDIGNFAMMLFNRGVRSWELPTALAAHIAPAAQPQPVAEQAVAALKTIERGEVEVFDDDLGEKVLVSMSAEEMKEVARAAIAASQHHHVPATYPWPERDATKPAKQQGLFRKFEVRRVDGSDQPGGKHFGCHYFVLDMVHDAHAPAAIRAYAASCRATHPELAQDIEDEWGTASQQAAEPERAAAGKVCTCPSGDGSLRWPCAVHPPAMTEQEERKAASNEFDLKFPPPSIELPASRYDALEEQRRIEWNAWITAWQARAALAKKGGAE